MRAQLPPEEPRGPRSRRTRMEPRQPRGAAYRHRGRTMTRAPPLGRTWPPPAPPSRPSRPTPPARPPRRATSPPPPRPRPPPGPHRLRASLRVKRSARAGRHRDASVPSAAYCARRPHNMRRRPLAWRQGRGLARGGKGQRGERVRGGGGGCSSTNTARAGPHTNCPAQPHTNCPAQPHTNCPAQPTSPSLRDGRVSPHLAPRLSPAPAPLSASLSADAPVRAPAPGAAGLG